MKRRRAHVPTSRTCGRCAARIRPARTATGATLWVDADPVPDSPRGREKPDEGLVAYRLDSTAVLHRPADLAVFFPRPAYRLHTCRGEG